ncbi:MAG: hypothetical protein NZ839_04470, partial [Endomicrobia bacterium]|nr:hypothetical protein [Endomicrobiia bacterium]
MSFNQTYISTPTISGDDFDLNIPYFLKFYYPSDFFEVPEIDHEDISIPYEKYVVPDIEKLIVDTTLFIPVDKTKNVITIRTGNTNECKINIKNISQKEIIDCILNYYKTPVLLNDLNNKEYNEFNYNLQYSRTYDNLAFNGKLVWQNKYITEFINQYSLSCGIKKFFNEKFELFCVPESLLIRDEIKNRLFFTNIFGLNIIMDKIMFIFTTRWLSFNMKEKLFYNITTTVKNLIPTLVLSASCEYDISDKRFYYTTELTQKIGMLNLTVSARNSIFYSYIYDYLLKFPEVKFDDSTFIYYPKLRSFIIGSSYTTKNFYVKIIFNRKNFSQYPTYVYRDNQLNTYYMNTTEFDLAILENKLLIFDKITIDYIIHYIISTKNEILFQPRLTMEVNFLHNEIFPGVEFRSSLLYKDKVRIASTDLYLNPELITQINVDYKLNQFLSLSLSGCLPLIGKNYLQPGVVLKPFVSAGV